MKIKMCVCLLIEIELGDFVALLVLSIGGLTLSNCSPASSAFCLPITEVVNSSIEKRRVTWAEAAAWGNICGRGRYLSINYNITFSIIHLKDILSNDRTAYHFWLRVYMKKLDIRRFSYWRWNYIKCP